MKAETEKFTSFEQSTCKVLTFINLNTAQNK